jgi:hypothetical protein
VSRFLLAILLLLSGVPAVLADTAQSRLEYWQKALPTNDFSAVLSLFKATPAKEWRAVHSVKYASQLKETTAEQQEEYRKLGTALLRQLEQYELNLKDLPPEQFCEQAEALFPMRKHLLKNPSYINLILADTINRVIYVNLAERLARLGEVPSCYQPLLGQLDEYRTDLLQLLPIINAELNTNLVDEVAYQTATNEDRLRMFEKPFENEYLLILPKNGHHAFNYRLVLKQNLQVLLSRLVLSDYSIHTCLPSLARYRKEAKDYTIPYDFPKLEAVLGIETKAPASIGGTRLGVYAATSTAGFLKIIQSGKMRFMLYFTDYKNIELLETLEND